MAEKPFTKGELIEMYGSAEWQEQFLHLLSLTALLRGCIIPSNYRVPDEMNAAIALTPYGQQAVNYLKTRESVGVKEARLQCLLVAAYREPMIDVEKTDSAAIITSISHQITEQQIRHPYIFGRHLYDRAADLFRDERDYLGVEDTVKLLAESYAGVWQVDEIVTGPYGILHSSTKRSLSPSTRIRLQHCVDPSCQLVHKIRLTTDYEAPINKTFHKMNDYLEKGGQDPSDWAGYIESISDNSKTTYNDLSTHATVYVLGELLAEDELRQLLVHLLNGGLAKPVRTHLESLGIRGSSADICQDLNHAQLMQLALLQSDKVILAALDSLILSSDLNVPLGEVRSLRIHSDLRHGAWGLRPEINKFGVRFSSSMSGLPILRLRRLIHELYPVLDENSRIDLDWQLRSIGGSSVEGRREEYLRRQSPDSIVANLVMHSRTTRDQAFLELQLEVDPEETDEVSIARILWKLGFSSDAPPEPHSKFWQHHDKITNLARAATLSTTVDEDAISAAGGVYFKALEGLLEDSLVYATWALSNDHFLDPYPYSYDSDSVRGEAFNQLTKAAHAASTSGVDTIVYSENKNTLFPLIRGFSILSDFLAGLLKEKNSPEQLRIEIPEYVKKTSLKEFPFRHKSAFLDLLPASQNRLISDLRELSKLLASSGICEARNDLLHFRRSTADATKLTDALEAVRTAIRKAEQAGLVRTQYAWKERSVDEWGRSTVILASSSGQSVHFAFPTAYDWLGLPPLEKDQFLFHHAVFDEPNEMLRFSPGQVSPFTELWKNYPRRAAAPQASIAKQAQSDGGEDGLRFLSR